MQFSFARLVLSAVGGLPAGLILVALGFAVTGQAISAPQIFPWTLGIAGIVGVIGGFRRAPD